MGVRITFVEFLAKKDLMEATEGMQENQVIVVSPGDRNGGGGVLP